MIPEPFTITVGCLGAVGNIINLSTKIAAFAAGVRDARKDMDAVSRELSSLKLCLESLQQDSGKVTFPDTVRDIVRSSDLVVDQMTALLERLSSGKSDKWSRIQWTSVNRDEMNKYRSSLESHKSALDIALDMASLQLIRDVKNDTEVLRTETVGIKQDTVAIKQDTTQIASLVQEIQFLRLQVRNMQDHGGTGGFILKRFLDESTTYADSVIDASEAQTHLTTGDWVSLNSPEVVEDEEYSEKAPVRQEDGPPPNSSEVVEDEENPERSLLHQGDGLAPNYSKIAKYGEISENPLAHQRDESAPKSDVDERAQQSQTSPESQHQKVVLIPPKNPANVLPLNRHFRGKSDLDSEASLTNKDNVVTVQADATSLSTEEDSKKIFKMSRELPNSSAVTAAVQADLLSLSTNRSSEKKFRPPTKRCNTKAMTAAIVARLSLSHQEQRALDEKLLLMLKDTRVMEKPWAALSKIMSHSAVSSVRAILAEGANPLGLGENAVLVEIQHLHRADVIEALLEMGADSSIAAVKTAIKHKWRDVVSVLLDYGMPSDSVGSLGLLLYEAIKSNDPETVSMLLDYGANPNEKASKGQNEPLYEACTVKDVHCLVISNLLRAGADVNTLWESADSLNRTPLAIAILLDRHDLVKLFLSYKANVNTKWRTWVGEHTALSNACRLERGEIVQTLLAAGADPSMRLESHGSALIVAAGSGQIETVRLLLEHGAKINDQNIDNGGTALYWACWRGHIHVVRFLIDRGADVNVVGGFYKTALGAARSPSKRSELTVKKHDIIAMLKEAGAREHFVPK